MLESFVTKGDNTYFNILRRYVRGTSIVPSQANTPVKIPSTTSATNPGLSVPIPLEGPQDAFTELFSLHGQTALPNLCTGTITSPSSVNVVGTGTLFLQQVLPGDTILVVDDTGALQTKTVATVTSNTALTVSVAFANAVTAQSFVCFTPNDTSGYNSGSDVNNRMTVLITDMAYHRQLMNRPVPVRHVFGTAQLPLYFKDAPLLQKNQMWMLNFYNNSTIGSPGSFFPVATGRKWQLEALKYPDVAKELGSQAARKTFVQPYWLTSDSLINIPDLGAVSNTGYAFFTNTGDVTLFLFYAYAYVINGGPTNIVVTDTEPFTVELFDTRNGRPFQNRPFSLNTGFGTAQWPFPLPCPIVLEPRSQIKAKIYTNLTNAPSSAINTEIAMTFGGLAVMTNVSAVTDPAMLAESRAVYRRASNPNMQPLDCRR
jgi:hypothetical protein